MPINPNPRLKNRHTIIISCTGGGKSVLMAGLPFWKQADRVLLFDCGQEHTATKKAKVATTKTKFLELVHRAINRNKKGEVIAFCPAVPTAAAFDWFCRVAWATADGSKKTAVAVEELSAVSETSAKASRYAAILLNQGRKYGVQFVGTVQRPQELPKTIMDACQFRYIGQQKGRAMRRKMAEEIGVKIEQVTDLKELEFLLDTGSAAEPKKVIAGKK